MTRDPDVRPAIERLQRLFERARDLEISRAPVGSDPAQRKPVIDLCAALLRLRIAPAFSANEAAARAIEEWVTNDPVHLTVLGSTNTGKSTVLNVLLGRAASGMRVTARFSQHPEAWAEADVARRFLSYKPRFAGYAIYENEAAPRQADEDLARNGWRPALSVRDPHMAPDSSASSFEACGHGSVLWDAPDVSTEEAQAWLPAVVDTLALAEVCLYVVTHESYADDRGLALFGLAQRVAAVVGICANKVASGGELLLDIDEKVSGASAEHAAVYPLPWVDGADERARLAALLVTSEAGALRVAMEDELAGGERLKRRALERSVRFLEESFDAALEPLHGEARVADRWAAVCARTTERELGVAYVAQYLGSRRYQDFGDALVELMRLLEVPGIGPLLKGVSRVVRLPVGLLKKAWTNITGGDRAKTLAPGESEHQVVARLFRSWLAALKAEAQTLARADEHPAWERIAGEIESARFVEDAIAGFEQAYRAYRDEVEQRVHESATTIYAKIAERPKLLNGLRAANLAGDAGITFSAVAAGGLSPTDWILGPLVHGLWEELVERGLGSFVQLQEEELKTWQAARIREVFDAELAVRARALFVGAFDPGELDRGRGDLDQVARAVASALRSLEKTTGGAR